MKIQLVISVLLMSVLPIANSYAVSTDNNITEMSVFEVENSTAQSNPDKKAKKDSDVAKLFKTLIYVSAGGVGLGLICALIGGIAQVSGGSQSNIELFLYLGIFIVGFSGLAAIVSLIAYALS
jgi:hypothetical protein